MFVLIIIIILFIIVTGIWSTKTYKPKPIFTYYVVKSNIDPLWEQRVDNILKESNWHKYYAIKKVDDPNMANVLIHLKPRSWMAEHYNKPPQYYPSGKRIWFSVTTIVPNGRPDIYLDQYNWTEGVSESGLSPDLYRTYLVNHEFGHALGFAHQSCNKDNVINNTCPVMYQSTRGCGEFICGTQPLDIDLTKKI
jgi:hypothetical protein